MSFKNLKNLGNLAHRLLTNQNLIGKIGGKKLFQKLGGKYLKNIPGLGFLSGLYFGYSRYSNN